MSGDREIEFPAGNTLKTTRRSQLEGFFEKRHECLIPSKTESLPGKKTWRSKNPMRGATKGKANYRTYGTHLRTEESLEVWGVCCGSRFAGEQRTFKGMGADSSR